MSRNSKVGGTKRRVLDVVGFTAIIVLFLLYMVPFILVLLNSFKQKRDIIKNPFSLITEKGYTLDKVRNRQITNDGTISGKIMLFIFWRPVAPSMLAASSTSVDSPVKPAM